MAKKDGFDFEALKALNLAKYIKQHCKPMQVKKAQAGIILADYKLKGVKQPCVFLPLKKMKEAEMIFKEIKANKEHVLKKVALVNVTVTKEDIAFSVKRGGLTTDTIQAKGTAFFKSNFKLAIKAAAAQEATQETTEDKNEAQSEQTKKLTPEKRAKVKASMDAMKVELAKISKALKLD
jgi:uncharacterized membrane protein YcgQ (UPF0703/DUF1980 family)